MAAGPQVIVGQERPKEHASRVDPVMGWGAVKLLAFLFICVGTADIALAFYPPRFSDKGWLFGVLGGVVGGLPVLSLGLTGALIAALTLRSRRWSSIMSVLNGLLALLIVVSLVLFAGTLETARRTAPATMQMAIARTVVRTFLLGGIFLVLHLTAAVIGSRGRLSAPPNT
jgi:hypothetical protein